MTDTLNRADTLLGICEALGEDLGFDPLWLRIALTAGMLWNPVAVIGAYLAAGVMIALVRRLTPTPRPAVPAPAPAGDNDDHPALTALAA